MFSRAIPISGFHSIPLRCVACGGEPDTTFSYVRNRIPIIFPIVTLFRRWELSLPYCHRHARAFRRRLIGLRIIQCILALAAVYVLALENVGLFLALFCVFAASIFGFAPFVYDLTFIETLKGMKVRCRSRHYAKFLADSLEGKRHSIDMLAGTWQRLDTDGNGERITLDGEGRVSDFSTIVAHGEMEQLIEENERMTYNARHVKGSGDKLVVQFFLSRNRKNEKQNYEWVVKSIDAASIEVTLSDGRRGFPKKSEEVFHRLDNLP